MKITQLHVYPIKSLKGVALQSARVDRQGVQYDRRYMLLRVHDDGHHEPVEVVRYPACALFEPEIRDGKVIVKYQTPEEPVSPPTLAQKTTLEIPLVPEITSLETVEVDLYKSRTMGYRMPEAYNSWFDSCFGFETILVYIGDGKRQVQGTMSPHAQNRLNQGWLSSVKTYIGSNDQDPHWLTFTCVASYLIVTEASLNDVSSRLPPGEEMDIRKFRPNIVVDGEGPFEEDYWGEMEVDGDVRFALTGNCGRCVSINVDYATGRPGAGESGNVLKKLMKDRRVDLGNKYSPIFGRYGFLKGEGAEIRVGDEVAVSKRLQERCVWVSTFQDDFFTSERQASSVLQKTPHQPCIAVLCWAAVQRCEMGSGQKALLSACTYGLPGREKRPVWFCIEGELTQMLQDWPPYK